MMQPRSSYAIPDLAQAFYRHMAEDADAAAFFVADPDDAFLLVHASASCGRYGAGVVQMESHLSDWLPALETARISALWQQLAEIPETDIETGCLFDGQPATATIRLNRWVYEGRCLLVGHVRRMDALGGDRQAEAELRKREQYQRTLLDNSPYFVWLKDEQSRLLAANIQYARVAGVADPRDLEGKTDFDFFPHELAKKYVADDQEVMTSGLPKNVEEQYCDEHGERHWMETWKSPLVVDGKVVGTVGCSRDITERKEYEAAIQARLEQEQQNALMAANLPGFLYICQVAKDGSLQFLHASAGVQALSGLSPESVIGAGNRLLELVHAEDRDMLQISILDSVEHLSPFNIEFRIRHPENGERWLHARSTPVPHPDGSVRHYGMMLDITARKQDEQRLRNKGIALAEAQRIAHLGSWMLDLVDHRLTWSDEVFRIFEIDPVRFKATYEAFSDLIHPDDREQVTEAYETSLKLRKPYQIEHRLLMSDGRIKYVLERGEHRYDRQGKPLSTQGTVLDITERKQAELALREREAFLDTLLDTMPLPVFYKDRAGRYIGFNKAYEDFFGATRESLLGKTVFDIAPPALADIYDAQDRALFSTGGKQQYESQVMNARGQLCEVIFNKAVFLDAHGNVAGLIGAVLDITERKRGEAELAASEARYRSSSNLLNAIFDSSPDVITFALDKDYRYLAFNTQHRQVMQSIWGKEIAVGMNMLDVIGDHPDRETAKRGFDRALAGENFVLEEAYGDERLSRKYWQNYWSPIHDADGAITGLTCFVLDITERKRSENRLQQLVEIIEQSAEFIGSANLDGSLRYHNRAALAMVGFPENADLSGMTVADMHPAWANKVITENAIPALLEHGFWRGESALLHRDGHEIPVLQLLMMHYDEAGKPLYQSTIMTDISARKRTESVLEFLSQQGWNKDVESFLAALSRHLGRVLNVDYVVIDQLADEPGIAQTLAIYAKGGMLPNIQYRLSDTPCSNVMDGLACCYPENVQALFPKDALLAEMGAESYAGQPLCDSTGKVVGLIAVLDGKPIHNVAEVGALLHMVAPRVAAEMERERYERAIKESHNRLQSVMQTLPDYVWMKSVDGVFMACNQAFEVFFGLSEDELVGKTDYDLFAPELADKFRKEDQETIVSGTVYINEEWVRPLNTQRRVLLEIRKVSVYGAHGEVIGVLGIGRDITERKRFESRLALQDQALGHVSEAIYLIDEDARILQANAAATHMSGYANNELLQMRVTDLDPNFGVEQWREHWRDLEVRQTVTVETLHKTKSGEYIPIEVNANRIEYQGRHYNFALVRDISERKKAQAALAERERELRTLTENIPDPIFRYDCEGRRTYVNPAVERMAGKPAADLLGEKPTVGQIVNTAQGADLLSAILHVVETEEPAQLEVDFVSPMGELQYHIVRLVPEYGADGQVSGVLSVSRNITPRKLAEQALKLREREFRTLAENTFNVIIRYDQECRRTYVNPAYLRDLPVQDHSKVLNRPLEEAWWPINITATEYRETLQRVMRLGVRDEVLLEWQRGDGFLSSHIFTMTPETDENGRPVGVLAIGHNITEFKRSEARAQQRERELRTLVENLPTYVVRLDVTLRHVYANPAYMSAVGIFEDQLYGLHVSAFWRAENISIEDYVAMLTRVLETGVQEEATLEWRSEHGRFYSHMVRVAPEFDASEQVSGLLVLGFDITAQRREQLLDAARQRVFVALAHGNELADVLGQVAGYIDASGRGMRAAVMLLDESGSRLKAIAAPSLPEVMVLGEIDLTSQGSCCAVAALRGERVVCEQPCRKEGATCAVFASRPDLQACWSHPIEASSGRTLGVVTVYLQKSGEPQSSDVELLQEAANLCAIAIERKHIEQQMQRHASYDSLTGLPNRRLFGQRLRQELMRSERLGEGVALLFVDLDHFKEVNDSLGHEVGDRLLVEAANRLRECVRESDTVARLGGDEFVVILTQVEDVSALGHLAQGMVDRLAQPFLLDAQPVYVSASVGVAGYPLDARDAEGLIRCADQAMYAAKQDGRNNFSFFTASIQQKVHSRLQLAGDLREAMDKGQLQVYYQPIVDIATGEVVKAEALLRWQHPVRGMVPPDAFIPVAEEHGLIHDIGDWVFRQAVMTAKRWNEAADGSPASPLRQISVNLSPRQFAKGRIDKTWLEYLESLNADPRSIAIEITEGLLLDDRMDIMEMLARFGMAGMQVALDDFGTGYSAMAYLKKFPIDYLKIDRSFVRDIENDPNDRAIAEAIVVMSRKLGLKVIAEGVETEGQREILNVVGCEYVQGYLYAKPMREEDFLAFAGVM